LDRTVPMVAVFDTAYHHSLPLRASTYAIPADLTTKHRIKRYGFHGIAHRFMAERYAAITHRPLQEVDLVTLQLGNGCSATAIKGGRSVDTSMGFTPLEGLMMGTRSGDIDPSVMSFLSEAEGVKSGEVETWLNTRSGLLGVSGSSHDMRELLEAEAAGDDRAALAVEMFCYRARKYIGAYVAALGGADAVVFGGGIGEQAPSIRARICQGLDWFGLSLDRSLNEAAIGVEERISARDSRVHCYVIPVNEAEIIGQEVVQFLRQLRE